MICRQLNEGEEFWCAGSLYTMLIPRDDTRCFEAVMESIAPGRATPTNAHATFVQMYFMVSGKARVHIGGETKETSGPAVAFIPLNTQHHVENIGDVPLQYIYVSIWPGEIPVEDGRQWREARDAMVRYYESRGFPAEGKK
ncbi:MAG: cupin domain-containing protein [Acidobacteria bacterium]|nr:cupin domain-containing protein [Acidobacteriota bacterium]